MKLSDLTKDDCFRMVGIAMVMAGAILCDCSWFGTGVATIFVGMIIALDP